VLSPMGAPSLSILPSPESVFVNWFSASHPGSSKVSHLYRPFFLSRPWEPNLLFSSPLPIFRLSAITTGLDETAPYAFESGICCPLINVSISLLFVFPQPSYFLNPVLWCYVAPFLASVIIGFLTHVCFSRYNRASFLQDFFFPFFLFSGSLCSFLLLMSSSRHVEASITHPHLFRIPNLNTLF